MHQLSPPSLTRCECPSSQTAVCFQAYTEPTASYLHGQPVYPGHQQGVVVQQGGTVTTIVTSQTVQQVTTTTLLSFEFIDTTTRLSKFSGGNPATLLSYKTKHSHF